ncbi:MAG: UbiX family flavin prenyltransferase [Desulforegulaceae bacterium]|nr:UbiX family flavin prenyltransferase [Desulforegulaceae bacterium]
MNSFSDGFRKKFVIACTGASGVIYFSRLVKVLLKTDADLHLIVSDSGKQVLCHETDYENGPIIDLILKNKKESEVKAKIFIHNDNDFFSPPASGSFFHNGMVIVPCSMKTLGSIASGIADSLITRSADVCLKEKRKLILVPRETPFNRIHLENMIRVNDAGAVVMPASPSFYAHPSTIENLTDSIVSKILNHLGVENSLIPQWGQI